MAYIQVISYEEATGELKNIYEDIIAKRGALAEVHKIQSLNPASILSHMELYMSIMFSKSPLSRSQREMMAVVVSTTNDCIYCQEHHGVALNFYWKDQERISCLKRYFGDVGLNEPDLALCHYARELTLNPGLSQESNSITLLRKAGFDDRAILDATLVIAYFNFVNRIVLALGVQLEDAAGEGYNY